ncbi:hypothetical protein M406DRAFT_64857 [Cryphonectria parasitica EP155]|uniref:Phosphoglycerate mutase family protein n=1 Tax=Cryphonectria parasitica (strain ATCC 38755 / EP155) TaxID=660469 RepID=A0A9P4XVS0_CRYP1|nr:uncharacterized protein M406DRAFT_64857 [Cryphonectria parasitica EP155]KAF3761712.1 hypothetical protein M406DRAFT_64857 [Cryphonectria parasitica EP155]
MSITVYLVRHAQGYHNLSHENEKLSDPLLTPLGESQCEALRASFPHHDKLTHLVASPMRRALLTCRLSFAPDGILSTSQGHKSHASVVAQPLIQEVSALPCDTGSDPDVLASEFGSWADLGLVHDGWNDKKPGSRFAPTVANLEARAAAARRWFRTLGKEGQDVHVAAVSHGAFLHFLTEDWDGMDLSRGTGWSNAEWRSYEFVEGPTGGDERASIRETKESWTRRKGTAVPLTETEQKEAREVILEGMRRQFGESVDDQEPGRS